MTALPRPRLLLAVLIGALLIGIAAPATLARVPTARPYRAGGAITLDTNLLSASGATAWSIDEYLQANTPLPPLGSAFMAAERRYGVNARFLLAAALLESGGGTSAIARVKHNLFGYNAFDRDPFKYATAYATYAANINATAKFMKDFYLSPTGRWWAGAPTLRSMQRYWSSSGRWGTSVSDVANAIQLDAFSGRAITAANPTISGTPHGSATATVALTWSGATLPDGVQVVASWQPVTLDADVIAAAVATAAAGDVAPGATPSASTVPGPSAAAPGASATAPGASATAAGSASGTAGGPVAAPQVTSTPPAASLPTVPAARTRSAAHALTLAVPTPAAPGQYQLSLDLRDSDGSPLPASERVTIPPVAARIWGDQSASIDLTSTPDGTGAVIRLMNTGRVAIPAAGEPDTATAPDPQPPVVRSTITVIATSADPAAPAPITLVSAPLATDLRPGASITFTAPGIADETGRSINWLSATLEIPGQPAWVAAYAPVGAWFSASGVSATPPGDLAALAGNGGFDGPDAAASPTTTAVLPNPMPAPTAPATPVQTPAAMPAPASAPSAPPAPVRHTTTMYGEHSSAVAYAGTWRDAGYSGYSGGNVTWATTPGTSATFTFTGSSVAWIGPLGPTRGLALVLIDGRAVTRVNLWRSSFIPQATLFRQAFASVAQHTLTIEVLSSPGHPYVAIDGFVVRT